MADVKISALPAATTPLAGTEVLPIVQSNTTKKVAISDVTAGRDISASSLTLTTPLGVASGGTGLSSLTTGYIPFGNGTSAFGNSANLFYSNTNPSLGIGTSSPLNASGYSWLTIDGSGANISLRVSGTENFRIQSTVLSTNINQITALPILFSTSNTERMRIDSSGNVGIGTTSPTAAYSYTRVLQITGGYSGLQFESTSSPSMKKFQIGVGVDSLQFFDVTNNTERMRIDSSGNVLVGTTSSPTSGTKCLTVGSGTAATASPDDTITVYSTDLSAGNTMLSLYTEGTPVNANTTAAATHRIAIRVNGTVYYLLANTAA